MKLCLLALALLAFNASVRAAAPLSRVASTNAPAATNSMVITAEAGCKITTNYFVCWKNVQAQDSQMYLACEQLTVWSKPKTTNAPQLAVTRSETSIDTSDIDFIVAETNVMMITAEMQVIGDRAVYSATNDVLTFTGELVVALTAQGSLAGTNIVFNRRTGEITQDGPFTMVIDDSLMRSNPPPRTPKTK